METALKVMRLTTERPSEGLLPNSGRGLMDKRPEANHDHKRRGRSRDISEEFLPEPGDLLDVWGERGKGRHWV